MTTNTKIPPQNNMLRRVLTFPLKALWLALRLVILAALIAPLILTAYGVYRLDRPMTLPEAQGLTYREFIVDRHDALKESEEAYEARPWACRSGLPLLIPLILYEEAPRYILGVMYPKSFINRTVVRDGGYDFLATRDDLTWLNFPRVWWELFEFSTWTHFTRTSGPVCRYVRPVNFDANASP
ncbi:MAG TPA: hypothetical protein PKG95_03160 [Anaerolineaceae bacterium]|nr:hypothetical protein [Anaerolineaceae bacterium]